MFRDGALREILDSKFMIELMYRYITNLREAEVMKMSLLVSKDAKSFKRLINIMAPWIMSSDPTDIYDKILMSEKFRNMEIPFGPQRSPQTDLRL